MLACLWFKISKLGFYLGFSFLINVTAARVLADFQKVWKLLKKKMAINQACNTWASKLLFMPKYYRLVSQYLACLFAS